MKITALSVVSTIFALGCYEHSSNDIGTTSRNEGNANPMEQISSFLIQLFEHNPSSAYSLHYVLDSGTIRVFKLEGIESEKDELLYQQQLSAEERTRSRNFILTFPLASLEGHYENPCVLDGDHKTVLIRIESKEREIDVENYYQKDIEALIELLNNYVPKELKIKYDKDELLNLMKDCNI